LPADLVFKKITERHQNPSGSHLSAPGNRPDTNPLQYIFYFYSNICPTRFNVTQFILYGNCSTCFGWYLQPSSGAHTNVSTASGKRTLNRRGTNPLQYIFYFYSNICPTRCNVTQFILSGNCSTCFGWYLQPSSGAHTNVSTASGKRMLNTFYFF